MQLMDKVKHSLKNITPFGGLNFIFKAIKSKQLDKFIDKSLGQRSKTAIYSYSDIVLSLFSNALCNGDYISDLQMIKKKYSGQFFNKIPSPDTVEYVCQELKTATNLIHTNNGVTHEINYDNSMNKSLVALAVETNQLSTSTQNYTLDFDIRIVSKGSYRFSISKSQKLLYSDN